MLAFTTDGAAEWLSGLHETSEQTYLRFAVRKGNSWLRMAGVDAAGSNDLALLAFLCWHGMSELFRLGGGEYEDRDYEVAGDVLDAWVTDHDAELLCEAIPAVSRNIGEPVGSMTSEVTAVHTVLLDVVGTMRDRWSEDRD
jgi:hypothetical protein